jgi:hypothetical protein
MMAGYRQILEIRRLETRIAKLGFMFCHSRSHGIEDGDTVALKPKDADSLPIYNRDAEVFVGSLTDLQYWLRGVEWAREYDRMIKVSDDKKRARKEQDLRNRQLVKTLKTLEVNE